MAGGTEAIRTNGGRRFSSPFFNKRNADTRAIRVSALTCRCREAPHDLRRAEGWRRTYVSLSLGSGYGKPFISLIPLSGHKKKRDIFSAGALRDKSALPCNRLTLLPVQLLSLHGVGPSLPKRFRAQPLGFRLPFCRSERPARRMRSGVESPLVAPTCIVSLRAALCRPPKFFTLRSVYFGD